MNLTGARGRPLRGIAVIPGDKSCSHRALILGAMADGETRIEGLGDGEDIQATIRALKAFGIDVQQIADGLWRVVGGDWKTPDSAIDCGNSGTTARLLIGAVAGMPGVRARFVGDRSLARRPMARLTEPLRRMGASIDGNDLLPLDVEGVSLGGIDFDNRTSSAQVKSAVLLAGLGSTGPVRIAEKSPSRDHSEIMLGQFGVELGSAEEEAGLAIWLGEQRQPAGTRLAIAADPSSAAFPLVGAALVEGSEVTVEGMLVNPRRTGVYETLERMGADIQLSNERVRSGEIVADVTVRSSWLEPCHVRAEDVPSMIDEIPILAMAAATADGESVFEGVGELRHKESDRLGAILTGLTACGVAANVDGDTLRIFGRGTVRGGRVMSHGDHRMAMAFATLGLASRNGVEVDGAQMVPISFPAFPDVMRGLGANLS